MRLFVICSLGLVAACSGSQTPTAYETLPQLRQAIDAPVNSDEQNRQHSQLVELISEEKHLHGLTRLELEEKVGQGDPCSRHPLCAERGFDDQDWYYEVGQPGESYVRYRPALIVGFSRFGKVERTFVLRVQ